MRDVHLYRYLSKLIFLDQIQKISFEKSLVSYKMQEGNGGNVQFFEWFGVYALLFVSNESACNIGSLRILEIQNKDNFCRTVVLKTR